MICLDMALVILSYNRKEEVVRWISLIKLWLAEYDFQVVIVDNSSTDGTQDVLRTCDQRVRIIQSDQNLGVAGGRNLALPILDKSIVVRVDDDCHLQLDSLLKMYEFMLQNPGIGAASPLVRNLTTKKPQNNQYSCITPIANYHGACHVIRLDLIKKIGPIDPLCDFGGEELDYSIKVVSCGKSVTNIPDVEVYHNNYRRQAQKAEWRKRRRVYNNARMSFKYWPIKMAVVCAARVFLSHQVTALSDYGTKIFFLHFCDFFNGVVAGIRQREKLDETVLKYYRAGDLEPDFGNKSVASKLLRRICEI